MKYVITSVAIIGIALLILLAKSLSNTDLISSDTFRFLVALSVFFVFSLIILITIQVFRLLQSVKKEIIGSRLTLRLVLSFGLMVLIPVSIVYLVSVNFLTKSIESWFDVRVESALEGGLTLGQKTVDILVNDIELKGKSIAYSLSNTLPEKRQSLLIDMREKFAIQDAVLFNKNGSINLISSSREVLIPPLIDNDDIAKASNGYFIKIEFSDNIENGDKEIFLKAFIPVDSNKSQQKNVLDVSSQQQILMLTQPIPRSIANIAVSVESVYEEYQQLTYSRNSLKIIYTLTLTLVLLLAILSSVAISFILSRKFSRPLAMLADATNEIAKGNYKKFIPESGKDELGVLVKSFNSMTSQLDSATKNAKKNRKSLEEARSFLEIILTNLVTAVVVIDNSKKIRLYNKSASKMLNFKSGNAEGKLLSKAIKNKKLYGGLLKFIEEYLGNPKKSMKQISTEFKFEHNQKEQIIILQISPLAEKVAGSYVLVIDDITMVTKAQRQIAWGEVARRLAHEIKNPLTPIQLIAERIQHKFSKKLNKEDSGILDKSTTTIVKQVNALKVMVNEFSEYSRIPKIQKHKLDIKQLLEEVVDLYTNKSFLITLNLKKDSIFIEADENKLRQVLINIFDNAKDALRNIENPQVMVELELKINKVVIVIKDNGIGIPKNIINRIFEPYVTSKDNGTGLGLAIVKKIIEEHNGTIIIKNLVKIGVKITIMLPTKNLN